MQLKTTLAGRELEHPLMNAAGTCKTLEDVKKFARSTVSAIVVGSITIEPRTHNPGNVYYKDPQLRYSLNSMGLPNPGLDYYQQLLPEMAKLAHDAGKPLIVSVVGYNIKEYARLAYNVLAADVDLIELNLSCPNVWYGAEQKLIESFDPDTVGETLAEVNRRVGSVAVKLSPTEPATLEAIAEVINQNRVSYVANFNTFPSAFAFDADGQAAIGGSGLAGMGGAAMKPIGLGQVKRCRELLPHHDIVGVGGVAEGRDMADYLRVGATAVQAATVYWNAGEDPGVYGDILYDYIDLEKESA